ncbi:bifunctional metallophosphatase/5'-nucleotidase [Urechidicola croceus]|uniref:Bifunctional metallophosphatase/5'-nucleotidase n=1 Tax=Urechidicola croceus TaxID=1850246 RepID=A0A1D8P4Z7_9FLAO|nr:bifunctional metallophosphatase/5'-nucleotidase [Urechidicola croceus]AOW19648.1 bifunctional metallophosphatase/5'-nucleotidase [Urechidicola croceus]
MKYFSFLLLSLLLISCNKNDNKLEFIVLQINDVYEIDALEGGKTGGLARVEELHQQLLKENPNTLLVHAGDFLNPSLLGALKDENGDRYKGKQMVEVMNAMNFDLVALGNHEFDIGYSDLQKRFNESTFQWISTNAQLKKDSTSVIPFYVEKNGIKTNIPRTVTFDFNDKDGTKIKVGFISATINSNPQDFVDYGDLYQDAINAHTSLKNTTDVVLGLTHVSIAQDRLIANSLPEIPIIFGGHEHTNMMVPVNNSFIAKADANAKTAYVHRITFDKKSKKTIIKSELVEINEEIEKDIIVENIIKNWNILLDETLKVVLADPYEIIYHSNIPLDGRDTQIRSEQTNLGKIITASMSRVFNDEVDCAILNGGSIRIDDEIQGEITGVDIFRVLPFGGGINKVEMTGELLERTLQYGRLRAGTGAYLQRHNITYENKEWKIGGKPIIKNKIYKVVLTDYLLLGYDIPFLKSDVKGVVKIYKNEPQDTASDIRKVVIEYLKSMYLIEA